MTSWKAASVAMLAACGACSTNTTTARDASNGDYAYGVGGSDEERMVPASGVEESERPMGGEQAQMLTDDQILTVLNTAHSAQIEQAMLAHAQVDDERVKEFAQSMLKSWRFEFV